MSSHNSRTVVLIVIKLLFEVLARLTLLFYALCNRSSKDSIRELKIQR